MGFIYKIRKKLFKKSKKTDTHNQFGTISYAQEGEDLILNRFLNNKANGFYIDVGAHHPIKFSNTYFFYKLGWSGINIDAMPGSMKLFNKMRTNDINIEAAISNTSEKLTYHIFNQPALNTFSEKEAEKKDGLRHYKIINRKTIVTKTLDEILADHLPKDQTIDFLSIDVEGLDMQVLQSISLAKYKPHYILIEELEKYPIEALIGKSHIYKYLTQKGYHFLAKTFNTLFFKLGE